MNFASTLLDSLGHDIWSILPQLFLVVIATLMLWPGDLVIPKGEKGKWAIFTSGVILITGLLVLRTPEGECFNRMFKVDGLTRGFQLLCVLGTLATIALSQRVLNALREQTVEYYALLLYGLAGMLFLCGASDLMTVYFSVELMAICIYILVAYLRTQNRGVEAGLKYFLLGAFSSGILLYGISLLFAAGGGTTTNLADLNYKLALAAPNQGLLVYAGILMVLVGLCFKVAAVPFHMWSPDAYDGAPTPITAWMATAPKAAALAAFLRVFGTAFHGSLDQWSLPLQYVAAASMILGNVAAMKQQSMKRLLAYSSIAHVGYMLLGVLANDLRVADLGVATGARAVWLYMLIYIVMNTGAFAVVIHLQGKGEGERIEDFRGLARTRPLLAFSMMVFLLSLAGIPPLAGFFGKFYLFKLAVEQGYTTLVVIAMLTSAISAYYYLGVVNQMYFGEPAEGETPAVSQGILAIVVTSMLLITVGTAFGPKLLKWTETVALEAPAAPELQIGLR
ncbi:MAG TPA: NADH-quinone oxidoreductase subunit N [Geothrix sp.]|nr:NADH-quinone oxidoreductase subunit N [Geothrix sp.]